jgi:1-acyl-sn-glycerol-3-phosphate acyltransferase
VLVALVGLVASLMIPPSGIGPRRARSWTPAAVHRGTLAAVFKDRNMLLAVLGVGWFWFTKITYLVYLPEHAATVFGLVREELILVLATPITGIVVGALLCSPASGRRIELGLVPLGALLMAVTGLDFYFATTGDGPPAFGRSLLDLFLLGIGSGLFVVPLMAWIIQAAPRARLGRVQGGMYLCVVLFLAVALGVTDWCHSRGIETSTLMLTSTLLHAAVSIYIFMLLPEFLLRLVMWVLVHTIYRVREEGLDNVPLSGPAVVVCNHVSYLDALVIGAKLRRPVRFVMHKHIFTVPGLGLLFRLYKAIPIASGKTDPETLRAALDQVAAELEAGQLVGIFPEGHLTHDGELDVFRSGIEKIVERTPVPVVPMALQGLWGSFFSNCGGPALAHAPRLRWSKLGLVVGTPVAPEDVKAEDLQARVLALRGDRR